MGLLDKIVEKCFKKKFISINFKNFCTENDRIRKTAIKIAKTVSKHEEKLFYSASLRNYQVEILDFSENLKDGFLEQSDNESYAITMAQLMRFHKVYCLYYMHAEDGKTDKHRQQMYDCLFQIRDLIIYNLLKYMIFIKHKKIVWTGNEFIALEPLTESEVGTIKTVCEFLDVNGKLIDAIKDCNNLAVYGVYNSLTFENINKDLKLSPFQI